MQYRVTIEQGEDGVFVVGCPALPGCVSQGAAHQKAIANIQDAIAGNLESLRRHGEPVPCQVAPVVSDDRSFVAEVP